MERRRLGEGGIEVSAVGLGTWRVLDVRGPAEADRHEVVGEALGAGVTLFDSSPMYGEAERVLGDALREHGRDRATVATKVWTPDDGEAERQIERALGFFGGRVELYQVHNLVATKKRLELLERLKGEGRVRSIGATHYSRSAFPELMDVMRTGRVDFVQVPYNADDVAVADGVLPLAEELGLGVIVMVPLGSGRLVRNAPSEEDLRPLQEFGVETWAQALLKFVLSDPRVTSAIPATSSPRRARENARAGEPPFFGEEEREYVRRLARKG
ncbi:aldo/keto reductase [Rubrobacter marinus]|uniref:Aldo/keto reductase n=1 Tax=Rubrobacter marinus TaxID=2653852 RepID=A0A6G8PUT3_9ACTN|nr:aldo/keto reductase [Rubrobacter marinus]QIN77645.1 aldo/keto reductase [Rubrobacter marinus]